MSGISGYGLHSFGTLWASARTYLHSWTPSFSVSSPFSLLSDYFQSSTARSSREDWLQSFRSGLNRLKETTSTLLGSLSSCWEECPSLLPPFFQHEESFFNPPKTESTFTTKSASVSNEPKFNAGNLPELPPVTEHLGLEGWREKFYAHFKAAYDSAGGPEEKKAALKKEYRKLVLTYHPDKNSGKDIDQDAFNALSEAHHSVLEERPLLEPLTGFDASNMAYDFLDPYGIFNAFFGNNAFFDIKTPDQFDTTAGFGAFFPQDRKESSFKPNTLEPLFEFFEKNAREAEERARVEGFTASKIKPLFSNKKKVGKSEMFRLLYDFDSRLSYSRLTEQSEKATGKRKETSRSQERIDEVRQFFQEPEIASRLQEVDYQPSEDDTSIYYYFGDRLGTVCLRKEEGSVYRELLHLYGADSPLPPDVLKDFTRIEKPEGGWLLKRRKNKAKPLFHFGKSHAFSAKAGNRS